MNRGVPVIKVVGELPTRNVTLDEARQHVEFRLETYVPPSRPERSPYLERFLNGATIYPRCFWFVRPSSYAVLVDHQRPELETDERSLEKAKEPWTDVRLRGCVESEFLFATLLSSHLLPFGWRKLSLVVLPIARSNSAIHLLNSEEAAAQGKIGLAGWVREAESIWNQRGKSNMSLLASLDYQRKLTRQKPLSTWKVIYNEAGTNLCSCVVRADSGIISSGLPYQGFIADKTTYWMETTDQCEAHYLCAILNSRVLDQMIKPLQPRGAMGERHIQRLPFQIANIPVFDRNREDHMKLAKISMRCHRKVCTFLDSADSSIVDKRIATVRQVVRQQVIPEELEQIDNIVSQMFSRE